MRVNAQPIDYSDEYFAHYPASENYLSEDPQRSLEAGSRASFVGGRLREARVLEVGSATGHFLRAAKNSGASSVVGIEPAPALGESCRKRGLDVLTGTIEQVEIDDTVDLVCAWHVLEHLDDPVASVTRLSGWLSTGGYLAIEVPNIASGVARRDGRRWRHLDPEHHVFQYTPRALSKMIETLGFEVEKVEARRSSVYYDSAKRRDPRRMIKAGVDLVTDLVLSQERPHRHELLRIIGKKIPS